MPATGQLTLPHVIKKTKSEKTEDETLLSTESLLH